MVRRHDTLRTIGKTFLGDPFHLMPQEDYGHSSPVTGKRSRRADHLKGQPIMRMVAMISKDPDI